MRLFALPDGSIDALDRAQWLTPPFDLGRSAAAATPTTATPPEVHAGPFFGAPWHARWRPVSETAGLVISPPPPPPQENPFPPLVPGVPVPGAPWFRAFVQEGLVYQPGAGGVLPGSARAPLSRPRVNRIVDKRDPNDRLRRAGEMVQTILNSLLDQGYIRLVDWNPLRYQIVAGSLSGSGPPGVDTDKAHGAVVGCCYVDTSAGRVYFCVSADVGAAVWRGPF